MYVVTWSYPKCPVVKIPHKDPPACTETTAIDANTGLSVSPTVYGIGNLPAAVAFEPAYVNDN